MNPVLTALRKGFAQLGDRVVARLLLKTALITLIVFLVLGALAYLGLTAAFAANGLEGAGLAGAVAAVLLTGLAFWFLFRVVALAVLQFFADEVVLAVETRHYPEAAKTARKLPFRRDFANSLKGAGRALLYNALAAPIALVLIFTAVGPAIVFLVVNAVLLGRELTDMAWVRHCGEHPEANPVPKVQRLMLGAVIAAIMLVPIANFLGAILGAAAGTHLVHGARERKG
ncbi:EI24 domain-containing protein [Erythrobacter sp. SCSIO 43205]|uniref:EI24 domain-containing protein n=1 Tax=Erythrobacter sp. SCSIO 43205 TaxID=2779361 RepID=UPI001CAA1721|nr:EI24 domain-containing protein [Erythrobacter sp. SCSIO 43205]UAB78429.1 EI24 domain-containing protein [Erythrobacter sp. SCSIO 43205]